MAELGRDTDSLPPSVQRFEEMSHEDALGRIRERSIQVMRESRNQAKRIKAVRDSLRKAGLAHHVDESPEEREALARAERDLHEYREVYRSCLRPRSRVVFRPSVRRGSHRRQSRPAASRSRGSRRVTARSTGPPGDDDPGGEGEPPGLALSAGWRSASPDLHSADVAAHPLCPVAAAGSRRIYQPCRQPAALTERGAARWLFP